MTILGGLLSTAATAATSGLKSLGTEMNKVSSSASSSKSKSSSSKSKSSSSGAKTTSGSSWSYNDQKWDDATWVNSYLNNLVDQAEAARKAGQDPTKYYTEINRVKNASIAKGVLPDYGTYSGGGYNTASKDASTGTAGSSGLQYQKPQSTWEDYYKDYYSDMQNMIEQQKNAQIASQLAAIQQAYDESRSSLTSQQSSIPQQAQQLRNQNEAMYYTQQLPALYAAMEAAGQRGGENITGMVGLNTARGQNIADISLYEANQLQAIQDALNQLQQQEASAKVQVQSGIEANALSQLLSGMTSAAQLAQNQQQLDLQALNDAYNRAFSEAGLTGYYGGQSTLAAQNQAFNQYMAQQQYEYQVSRDKVLDDQWMMQFNAQQQQQMLDEAYRNRQISVDEYQAKTARINASNQYNLSQQQFSYEQQQNAQKQSQARIANYQNQIEQLFTITGPSSVGKTYDFDAIKAYIQNLNQTGQISDTEAKQLLGLYGFSY